MSEAWFWLDALTRSGQHVLSADESRHVTSRRLRVGDEIVVFDGAGRTASACLTGTAKRAVTLDAGPIESHPEPPLRFALATAIPKGDRLGTLLQMAMQLGLQAWQPLVLEHSVVRKLDPDSARLQRILIEGCKVARRPWAMQILPPASLEAVLSKRVPESPLFFGDRTGDGSLFSAFGDSSSSVGKVADPDKDAPVWLFVGPEAGLSASEQETLRTCGAQAICFSPYNLRIETAAVAAMVAFNLAASDSRDAE